METILGYIAAIAIVILTIVIYIKWTSSETVITFSQEGRTNYRIQRAGISFLIAGVIVCSLYWIISKAISIALVVITWLFIFAIITGIVIFVIGLFTKADMEQV